MELLTRYLQAIKGNLPRAQRDDILEEISADILAQADDKESELGRPLSRDEETAILKAYGHPRIVASRYWKTQYLIGPLLLPFYFYMLRMLAIFTALLAFGLATINGAAHGNIVTEMAKAWATWWGTMLSCLGLLTVVFALIERSSAGSDPLQRIGANRWDPAKLPMAETPVRFLPTATIFEMIFNGVFLAWLLETTRTNDALALFTGTSSVHIALPFALAPIWKTLTIPLAVFVSLYIIIGLAQLLRPSLLRVRIASRILYNIAIIVVAGILMSAQPLIIITGDGNATQMLTIIFRISFALGALIAAWEARCDLRVLLPKRTSVTLPSALGVL